MSGDEKKNASETVPSQGVFPQTQQFLHAISIINEVNPQRLPLILARIIDNLHQRNARAFTKEEQEKLCDRLSLSMEQFNTVISCSSFIFDICSKNALKSNKLNIELERSGMNNEQIEGFIESWMQFGPKLVDKLKETCFAPTVLQEMNWSLQMSVASQTSAHLREPRAIFEFKTGDPQNIEKESDSFFMELSMQGLTNLFQDLEKIQQQLDSLT